MIQWERCCVSRSRLRFKVEYSRAVMQVVPQDSYFVRLLSKNRSSLQKDAFMTAANWLTAARIFMSPFFVLIFVQEGLWARIAALLLIIASELTDAFDGALARKRGEVTDFGKLLDPLADSISRITVFVAFMWSGLIPWWMLLVFIYRDSTVATMRTICAYRGEVVAARVSGKIKAIVQATAIITILVARIANSLFPQYLADGFCVTTRLVVDAGDFPLHLVFAL